MFDVKINMHQSRKTVDLTIPSNGTDLRLNAFELENLIRELARVRASMLPTVSDKDLTPQDSFSTVPATRWYVEPDMDAPTQIRLYLLHLGFGWLFLPLIESSAIALAERIHTALHGRPKLS